MAKNVKQRRKVGDVLKIDLGEGQFAFARVLPEPLMAFYDYKTVGDADIGEVLSSPILFMIWVMNNAVTSGQWEVIGNSPLESDLMHAPEFFKFDPLSKTYSLYRDGKEIPATVKDCEGLERAAVWSADHVEDRLRDHFAGVPNKWVESLRAKPV